MKVNINGKWFDAEKTPIQIQLSNADKKNIANMHEDKFNYICFPDELKWEDAEKILEGKDSSIFFIRFNESKNSFDYSIFDEMKKRGTILDYGIDDFCIVINVKNIKKYLTYEDIFDLAFEKLNIANPNVDKVVEIAELLDLEYDKAEGLYINPKFNNEKLQELRDRQL